jgi:hypothetical protein
MDGLEIVYRLKRLGTCQADIARALGVSASVVGNVIHGRITRRSKWLRTSPRCWDRLPPNSGRSATPSSPGAARRDAEPMFAPQLMRTICRSTLFRPRNANGPQLSQRAVYGSDPKEVGTSGLDSLIRRAACQGRQATCDRTGQLSRRGPTTFGR